MLHLLETSEDAAFLQITEIWTRRLYEEVWHFLDGSDGNAGDSGSIPGSGRFPRGGNVNPLQYSCLDSSTDRGACGAAGHGSERWTRLSD